MINVMVYELYLNKNKKAQTQAVPLCTQTPCTAQPTSSPSAEDRGNLCLSSIIHTASHVTAPGERCGTWGLAPARAQLSFLSPSLFLLLYNGPFTPRQPGIQSKILT